MNIEECDNKNKDMEEDCEDDEDYHDQSGDEDETDATETSEQCIRRKITTAATITQKQISTAKRKYKTKSTKITTVARKLILKTPNLTPQPAATNNTPLSTTPICARTRGKRAAKSVKKLTSPSITTSKTKAKLVKSNKKRGSAIKSVGNKSAAAASAAGEIEQQQDIANSYTKRKRRTRRCLIKTDLATSESLQDDDSNSIFSPDDWKMNTETMYSRNCKK